MGRMYSAIFTEQAVTAAVDFFEINAPSDALVVLHGFSLSQSSDAGDAEDEQLAILVHRSGVSGSGGSSATVNPLQFSDPAFQAAVEILNTTKANAGSNLYAEAFNVRAGLNVIFTPETRIYVPPSGRVVIELADAPADSLTMSGTALFEELG